MKIVKDDEGEKFYVQARHVSLVTKSLYTDYVDKDGNAQKATEVFIYGAMICINAPFDDVIAQLGI
jgi:hypothetical protein